jgi:multidrug efflux pump subunit AcrA (membrane-fusion protein)
VTQKDEPGREALIYNPSVVSWAVADIVARPPSAMLRLTIYMLFLIVIGAGVFSYFSKVAITVSGRGVIRNSAKVRPVRMPVAGKIAEILVKNGTHVKKGDALVEMEDLLSVREVERIKAMLARIEALLRAGDTKDAMTEAGVLVQEPLRTTGPVLVQERSRLSEAINAYYLALRQAHDAVPELSRADAAERAAAEEKIAKIHAQHLEQELHNDLADLERTVARLKVSLRDRKESGVRGVASAHSALEVQAKSFAEALRAQMDSLRILAPVDGSVSNLTLTGAGELVSVGTTVMELIPDGGQLVAEVQIANKDIAQLRLGMPTKIKLDAYPYQDWGVLTGKVVEISQDAIAAQKDAAPIYLLQVSLDRTELEARVNGGAARKVILGMTLTADIQTRNRTLLELALVEILKLKDLF